MGSRRQEHFLGPVRSVAHIHWYPLSLTARSSRLGPRVMPHPAGGDHPFAALKLRTDAAVRYENVGNATAVIWKMSMIAEKRFRRLKAPELTVDVYQGAQYVHDVRLETYTEEVATSALTHLLK